MDCGMFQERGLTDRNWAPFPVSPETVDAVILTHAHIDHSGLLPKLVRDGFKGKIYCTQATCEISKIMLLDTAHLQEEDAEFKKKRHEREGREGPHPEMPLYTTADAQATFPHFQPVEYIKPLNVSDDIQVDFHNAGHVLGSAMVKLTVTEANEQRTVLFSGDVGRWDKPILKNPSMFTQVDYVFVESTYGDRLHDDEVDISQSLADIVNSTWQGGGNIVIPSFALQRSQEVLYYLDKLLVENRIPHLMVFVDSPMAQAITEVFKQHSELFDKEMMQMIGRGRSPFHFPGLKMVESVEESKSINHIKGTVIIIAGSGMCTGGRIKHHLVTNITRPESTILFVGYQASGTLGRTILDGAETVRILGQYYPVKARVAQIHAFSSHADRNELLRWLSGLQQAPKRTFVIHGDTDSAKSFGEFIREQKGWDVVVPSFGDEVILD